MENQNQKYEDMTIFEKMDFIRIISLFPAITVMVFIRRKIGFRMMKPAWLIIMAIIMLTVPMVVGYISAPYAFLMPLFAIAMLALGLTQRYVRWQGLCKGERWHTRSAGVSYFELVPLPEFFRSHARIYRMLDPLACVLAGMIIAFLSHGLGLWIIVSGVALFIYEQNVYEKSLARDLDTLDGLLEAEIQNEAVKHFEGKQPDQKQRTVEETAGIQTGLAPDIHKQVELRRAKAARMAKLPSDLVTESD